MKKPFHKHITHRLRKYHSHVTKYLYERDTIMATAWVFIFILAVKFLPMPNMHFFDPIELALEDFDFNDIAYSQLKKGKNTPLDTNIVIINIGQADREGIAEIIKKTASMHPKVIGLDAYFEGPREPEKDSLLGATFLSTKDLVVASRIKWGGEGEREGERERGEKEGHGHHGEDLDVSSVPGYFDSLHIDAGYVNITGREKGTMRHISPFESVDDSTVYCFAAMLVKKYDSLAFEKLKTRKNHDEVINYKRNLERGQYQLIEPEQLLNDAIDERAIRGKIALLGYVNLDPEDEADKKITPMNEKFADKTKPDMNGIVVHANIISMILERQYINKLPLWVNIIVAILIGWLHMSFFIRYYLENHIWFHLVAKIAQLLSAVFFVWLGIILFDWWNIKLDMSLTLVVIVLAVDIIYFYEAFAVWLHKKWGYRTVFHKQHH